MKIDSINKNVSGSSSWNRDRKPGEELKIDLNIGDIPDDMQDDYAEEAENFLCDEMTDDMIEMALSHDIWDSLCNK